MSYLDDFRRMAVGRSLPGLTEADAETDRATRLLPLQRAAKLLAPQIDALLRTEPYSQIGGINTKYPVTIDNDEDILSSSAFPSVAVFVPPIRRFYVRFQLNDGVKVIAHKAQEGGFAVTHKETVLKTPKKLADEGLRLLRKVLDKAYEDEKPYRDELAADKARKDAGEYKASELPSVFFAPGSTSIASIAGGFKGVGRFGDEDSVTLLFDKMQPNAWQTAYARPLARAVQDQLKLAGVKNWKAVEVFDDGSVHLTRKK